MVRGRFNMSLFSAPSEIDIVLENDTDIKGLFKAGDVDYKVWSRHNHLMSGTSLGENVWEIFFAMCEDDEDKMHGKHDIKINGIHKGSLWNVIKVMSTVINFIEYIIERKDPDNIVFSAKDKKQQQIYLKMINRFQKETSILSPNGRLKGKLGNISLSEKGNIIIFEVKRDAVV